MPSLYTDVMPIDHIPDWEKRIARQDAFWDCEIIDRPVVHITFPEENPDYPFPAEKNWATYAEQWMDAEYQAEKALAQAMNIAYMGDALPTAFPNLGPEVFSAFLGTPLEYSDRTAWSIPNLQDWDEVDQIRFSEDNFYWKKKPGNDGCVAGNGQKQVLYRHYRYPPRR